MGSQGATRRGLTAKLCLSALCLSSLWARPHPAAAWSSPAADGVGVEAATPTLNGPTSTGSEDSSPWRISRTEFTDLWFGALAVLGLQGSGLDPLYDVEYPRRLRDWKDRSGVGTTPLDRVRPGLASALSTEVFEVLHFVPVYFAGVAADDALSALRAVVEGSPSVVAADTRLGVEVLTAVLATERDRALLGELVAMLFAEREALGRAVRPEHSPGPPQPAPIRPLADHWNDRMMPALAAYLKMHGLDRGRVLVTPTIAREGRFFAGDPSDPDDNVVIIGYGPGVTVEGAAAAIVRELCYPVVRKAFEELEADRVRELGRIGAARMSDSAATRCGRMLLERYLPDELGHYDTRYGPAASAHRSGTELEDRLDRLMEDLIQSS